MTGVQTCALPIYWKKDESAEWDTSYDIVVKAQDKTTKENPMPDGKRKYNTTNEYGYGGNGKKVVGMGSMKPEDEPENGYYYYLDKSNSQTVVTLDKNNKEDNKIEYVYNLANTITIKNKITGDYATEDTSYPVILTLTSNTNNAPVTDDIACRYNIGKPEHKRFLKRMTKAKTDEKTGYRLGVLKFRNGECKGLFDKKTGNIVEGTEDGIPMWNENEILIDQMRANDYVLGVTIANNGDNIKPERKVYLGENTPVKLNKNGSFNDEIRKDNIYTIKNSADKKIKTGAYRRISPYIPIAIAVGVLLGNVIYVIITNRKKIKK